MKGSPTRSVALGVALAAAGAVLATGIACASGGGGGSKPPPRPVDRVDLDRYAGLWHQVALIPNRFQSQCVRGTTARYEFRPDGRIDVVNRCVTADGEVDEARGLARVTGRESNARLEVSFFSILGWRPVWGDYWVLGLGEDYEWAVVGTPDRRYGWILSREPELSPATRERIDRLLVDQGYDPADFVGEAPS